MLYDGFPWGIKKLFKDAMKNTITYTNHLCHIDDKKIPLEQQICLLSTSDAVKEKGYAKTIEVKSKTDDSGTKARQYLDGLLVFHLIFLEKSQFYNYLIVFKVYI